MFFNQRNRRTHPEQPQLQVRVVNLFKRLHQVHNAIFLKKHTCIHNGSWGCFARGFWDGVNMGDPLHHDVGLIGGDDLVHGIGQVNIPRVLTLPLERGLEIELLEFGDG